MKKILKWLDNFWYHNKWQTIIIAGAVIILSILIAQFITKDEYDFTVIYAGPVNLTANQSREAANSIASLLPEDYNGDGKKNAAVLSFYLLTDEQQEKLRADADEMGDLIAINQQEMNNTRNSFTTHVFTGESSICILDPAWYDLLLEQEAFVPLSEVLDEVPDYALDEYSVRLCDTPFANRFSCLNVFPSDTVLCLRRMSTASMLSSKEAETEKYEKSKDLFRAMFK